MEIDGKNPLANLNSTQRIDVPQQSRRMQKPGEGAPLNDSDRIELSVRGREIQHLDKLIQSTPDVRDAKVEQIRSAIESGTYNVKAEKIADKFLSGSLIDEVL
jgi:negative regulator of flagellin synthesis FlgM